MAGQLAQSGFLIPLLVGFVPSVIWVFFWLGIDKEREEPFGLLLLSFIAGGISVLFATLLQQGLKGIVVAEDSRIVVWAAIEEIIKFLIFYIVAYKSGNADRPIDPALYMIVVALGFAAVENVFYVLQPNISTNMTAILLTGGMRFFGATLLHTIASGLVGISMGIAPTRLRFLSIPIGIGAAIFLHATFNFFILKNDTASVLQTYGYLWVAAIISHIILEKLRRIPVPQAPSSVPIS